jgi:hypothetical protein
MKAPWASVKPSELKFMSENDLETFLKLLLRGQIFHAGRRKLFFYEIEWQGLVTSCITLFSKFEMASVQGRGRMVEMCRAE